mmetsp:Transcript_58376/g.126262  ORF Transcript_58376/g.126262 Transcript_58376/m.126262 type:complete len:566 (-) Transcript_58376:104-1801(-)
MTVIWPERGLVTSVLFPCPESSYTIDSFPGELIWIPRLPPGEEADDVGAGETVPCLFLPYESARFLIIFFHSNAEDLGRCRWFCHFLRDQFQVHVLAVEYPGYGVCPGQISPESVLVNANAALRFVLEVLALPLEQVKVFGRSIGTAPALSLAARHRVAGVILVAPFLSVQRLFRDRVGPFSRFVDEWFQNDKAILKVSSPTIIIHGRKDTIIPYQHSEALYQACVARKLFINPNTMEHNTNLTTDISILIVPMFRFFSLPDYSFQALKVPAWIFDKRYSPLYVCPNGAMNLEPKTSEDVCLGPWLHASRGDDNRGTPDAVLKSISRSMDDPVGKPTQVQRARLDGDSGGKDFDIGDPLTHPTVLHCPRATKRQYDFRHTADLRADGEELPIDRHRMVRRSALGHRRSATAMKINIACDLGRLTSSASVPRMQCTQKNPSLAGDVRAGPDWNACQLRRQVSELRASTLTDRKTTAVSDLSHIVSTFPFREESATSSVMSAFESLSAAKPDSKPRGKVMDKPGSISGPGRRFSSMLRPSVVFKASPRPDSVAPRSSFVSDAAEPSS